MHALRTTHMTHMQADAYARMEDADMRRIPSLPQPALAPLQALRRAAALLECWRAVAALRQVRGGVRA